MGESCTWQYTTIRLQQTKALPFFVNLTSSQPRPLPRRTKKMTLHAYFPTDKIQNAGKKFKLKSFTGSAPSSVHGSRVDMSAAGGDKGSAIYVGCSAPKSTASTWSMQRAGVVAAATPAVPGSVRMSPTLNRMGSGSGGGGGGASASQSAGITMRKASGVSGTPPASPKHMKKRYVGC